MTARPSLVRSFFATLLQFALLFLAHRLLSYHFLVGDTDRDLPGLARILLVGSLSDLWLSGLFALLLSLIWSLLSRLSRGRGGMLGLYASWFLAAVLVALHHSYVEFFHFPIMIFHLRYFNDQAFMLANVPTLFAWPLLLYLGLTGVAIAFDRLLFAHAKWRRPYLSILSALLLLVLAHNQNIHYRVQWFVPENLQTNMVERLYIQVMSDSVIQPIEPLERKRLKQVFGLESSQSDFTAFLRQIQAKNQAEALDPIAGQLKSLWQKALRDGRKPVLMVVLLESLRSSETGYFSPERASLTPNLDRLVKNAIVFRQAYSTGSVTRGGQEAVFCGHLSSRDTSLMRFDVLASIRCLPDFLAARAAPEFSYKSFWHHGGDGRFDNQLSFWQKHHISDSLSQDKLPPELPSTSWGIGDRSFLKLSARRLKELRRTTSADALLGMILTVSNHIPWKLPSDFIPRPLAAGAAVHPSYLTHSYADLALGDWATDLKNSGIWQDAMIVLVSDHGNLVPPYAEIYPSVVDKAPYLQSHINLMLVGGLVESALAQSQLKQLEFDHFVSQVDISQWIADLVGIHEFVSMGENLFRSVRRLPILSRLEQELFDPKAGLTLAPSRFLYPPEESQEESSILFYRQYLEFIQRI